ncbi:MAG: ABC transporter permease, partial [Lachnospiraceae bacterium]|nr:ABC transporter permease [Lachnospiraceae bacterium]
EVAITESISELLGVNIGDTITIDFGSEKKECLVVGIFQTMNQLGKIIRLHEDAPTSMNYASGLMAYQIDFYDNPDAKTINSRIEMLKDFYETENVMDAAGYCDDCMGVADTMDAVSKLLLLITCIVVVLVTVLMEKTFISDEKDQIALLKAVGFTDGFVMRWHICRFMIVALVSEILAVILTYPVTRLWADPIWKTMGASHVEYLFRPVSLLLVYPGIIILVNLVMVYITALNTRKITSCDVSNIE